DRLGHAQAQLEGLRSAVTARQEVEEDARRSLRRLEAVVAGNRARGAAGENILDDALRHLPPDMVQRNAWIKGRVVEFALHLPRGLRRSASTSRHNRRLLDGAALSSGRLPDAPAVRSKRRHGEPPGLPDGR